MLQGSDRRTRASLSCVAKSTHPDVVEIETLLDSFTDAVRSGDNQRLMSLHAVDAVAIFTGSTGRVAEVTSISAVWADHLASWKDVTLNRRDTLVRIHGDVAWASFFWDGAGVQKGKSYRVTGERWSLVVIWEEGRWRIAQTHASLPFVDWEKLQEEG
ncbi:MAG: hypothetical protein CME26_02620 [Gemmatimonadetes bacterium]|nr:hypothetical protein [Gemmatimonadota bacterium]